MSTIQKDSYQDYVKGDIVAVTLGPNPKPENHEQLGYRPCVVVNDPILGQNSPFIVICPITNDKSRYPLHIHLSDYPNAVEHTTGEIMVEQVKSVDARSRKTKFIEHIYADEFYADLDNLLGALFGLNNN